MAEVIKREDVANLLRQLNDCKLQLKKQNIYSCLLGFRNVLRQAVKIKMLPKDEKTLLREINLFQDELAASRAYRYAYGPASFCANDLKTTLDFIEMLINVKEEELIEKVHGFEGCQEIDGLPEDIETTERVQMVKRLLDQGDFGSAQEMVGEDETIADLVFNLSISTGIMFRQANQPDKAVLEYRKALAIYPDDEGVYYNIARAYIEMNDWQAAREAIQEALRINGDFVEGRRLLGYIEKMLRK